MDVIFYEVFKEEEQAIKNLLPSWLRVQMTPHTIQEKGDKCPPAPLISVRTQSRIPLDWAGEIKGILTRSQGYDHLLAYRRRTGRRIPCGYLGDYCSRAVAEHAVLMMLALIKKFKLQLKHFESFDRDGLTGEECPQRPVLVVGVGNIGSEIVDIIKGLRMAVKGVDLVHRLNDLEYIPLEEGIRWAEIVFCALPLTSQTESLLNYSLFREAPRPVFFINISRGEISPVEDLNRLFEEGVLLGLGLDVFPAEEDVGVYGRNKGLTADMVGNPFQLLMGLHQKESVIFTPHNAFNTREALQRKAKLSVESIAAFLRDGKFLYSIPNE